MTAPLFLRRVYLRPGAKLTDGEFPCTLPFVRSFDLQFEQPVTILIGENGSGKSTVVEAIAQLCGLPVGGGGRNELADLRAPHSRSELAPFLRAAFQKKPRDGYFFRAEFQAHFASLLEERKADPDFLGDPYTRYGGRSLHTRSHGEAFLSVLSSWMAPGLIVMDEPEAALSPQRQLSLLAQMVRLVRDGGTQFVIATHSPIVLAYPGATILACTDEGLHETAYDDAEPVRLTRGFLDSPQAFLRALLED